jgi:hypothetical protein
MEPGRPISGEERSNRSSEHLMLYCWKMLVRKDYGGSSDKGYDLRSELDRFGVANVLRAIAAPDDKTREDRLKRLGLTTVSFDIAFELLKKKWCEVVKYRVNRVYSGTKDRLSHTKDEFIHRINAVDKFHSRVASGEQAFASWDSLFGHQFNYHVYIDDERKLIQQLWNRAIEYYQVKEKLANDLMDAEDAARREVKYGLDEFTKKIRDLLIEFDEIRDKVAVSVRIQHVQATW